MYSRYAYGHDAAATGSSAESFAPSYAFDLPDADALLSASALFVFLALVAVFPVSVFGLLPAAVLLRIAGQNRKNTDG